MILGDSEFVKSYYPRYASIVNPKHIWHQKQNYPEVIVEDILKTFEDRLNPHHNVMADLADRDILYGILLRRGVNKWFLVRKLLIRLKKQYTVYIKQFNILARRSKNASDYWYYKGKRDAYMEVRENLKTLCMAPRYVVFRERDIGFIDTVGLPNKWERRFIKIYRKLISTRFKK